jgi:hypothetical protein
MNPTAPSEADNEAVTRERLRLLAIGFYVKGAIGALFVSFFLIHFVMLLSFSFMPQSAWQPNASVQSSVESTSVAPSPTPRPLNPGPPVAMMRIFAGVIGAIILLGWTFGALTIYAGRCVQKRQRRVFIYVMAGLNCPLIPWGTLLGICTFTVLQMPVARREFGLPPQRG